MSNKIGVILVNLGSPAEATPKAVSEYLWQFLRDKRVVDLPAWKWWPLLKAIILPHRAKGVAELYQHSWTAQGSLLIAVSQQQQKLVQRYLREKGQDVQVELAMTYGQPNLTTAVDNLMQAKVEKLIVLPLFPQYSSTTTAAVFDAFVNVWQNRRDLPPFEFIHNYADNPDYIQALAQTIRRYLNDDTFLLFSYHGIPLRYEQEGDNYRHQCELTTQKVIDVLGLAPKQWGMTFQSRFGREEWLSPYTDEFMKTAPKEGVRKLAVVCPGFSADCLETVEEIAQENRQYFLHHGGEDFQYIPALNTQPAHIAALGNLILKKCEA